jgi:hypothetical protein
MVARAFIGSGNVMLNPYDPVTGLQTGWVDGGSADKFALKPNSEIKSKKSKGRDTYGQTIATVALAGEADISITFGEVNKENIRLAFMARQADLNIAAGGTVADEALVAKLDKYVPLAHANLTNAVVVTHTSGSPTYQLGVDYEVNYRKGWIKALSTGSITADQSLKVDYVSNAIEGTRLRGSTDAQLRCEVLFDGKNQVDGSPVEAHVWEAVLTPSDEFDFLADDWGQLTMTGKMTTPLGKTEPYTVDFKEA